MKTIQTLHFGQFQMSSDIMVGEINEGVHFNQELNAIVCDLARSHFGTKRNFAYISHRKYQYSIDPMVHHINKEFSNLKCFALVDPNGIKPTAVIESKFYVKERFRNFYVLEDAIEWVGSVLHQTAQP